MMLHLWTDLWGEKTLLTHISVIEAKLHPDCRTGRGNRTPEMAKDWSMEMPAQEPVQPVDVPR